MKFVGDEGVDAPIVVHLRQKGHTVWYVAEMAAGTADEDVLAWATQEEALLITADKDFALLFSSIIEPARELFCCDWPGRLRLKKNRSHRSFNQSISSHVTRFIYGN